MFMSLLRRSGPKPSYAVWLTPPHINGETPPPFLITALQYQVTKEVWRAPETREEALWVVNNNFAITNPDQWKAVLVEFKPRKQWKFRIRSVEEQYPHLVWSEADQKYVDPTKVAPEEAGWTQAEADAGKRDDATA